MKPSQRHNRDADLIMEFRNAYVDLLNNARAVQEDYYSLKRIGPSAGVSGAEWSRLYSETAKAAGAATQAHSRHGAKITLRNAAYVTRNVDLLVNWEMSLRDPEQVEPTKVVSSAESAIARARQKATEAAALERGLTGLIAAFLRWPSTLREAAGPGAQRTAAGVIGILGQLFVGVLASVLATGLVAVGVIAWRSVL